MMIGNFSYDDRQHIPGMNLVYLSGLYAVGTGNCLLVPSMIPLIHDSIPIKQFRWFCHRPTGNQKCDHHCNINNTLRFFFIFQLFVSVRSKSQMSHFFDYSEFGLSNILLYSYQKLFQIEKSVFAKFQILVDLSPTHFTLKPPEKTSEVVKQAEEA